MLNLKPRAATRTEKSLYAVAFAVLVIAWLAGATEWYWCLLPGFYLAASFWLTPKANAAHTPSPASGVSSAGVTSISPEPGPSDIAAGAEFPRTFLFSYLDHHDNCAPRTVEVHFVSRNINTGHYYLEGFCQDRLDNRTFRTDRIRGDLTDTETGELVPVAHLLSTVPPQASMDYKPPASAPQSGTGRKWQTAVFFAGFRGSKLNELEGLADAAGWQVRWNISPTVDYVVRNGSAGKKQLEEAESLGVSVIDETTFRALAC